MHSRAAEGVQHMRAGARGSGTRQPWIQHGGLWFGLPTQDRLLRKLVLLVWNAHLLLHLLWAMLFEVAEDQSVFLS